MHEFEFLLPAVHECLIQSLVFGVGEVGIRSHEGKGFATCLGQKALITDEMGHPQLRESGLTRAQELPGTSDLQITFGDHKPIVVLCQRL